MGLGLFEAPGIGSYIAFHPLLNIIGQIAEEVDAGLLFQFINGDDILLQRLTVVVAGLVLNPESHGLITLGVLAEQGHIEILRYGDAVAATADITGDIGLAVDSSALADVEGVAEIVAVPCSHHVLHILPSAGIEAVDLWLHVGHVECLAVGLCGAQTVGRRTDVAMVVAGAPVGIGGEKITAVGDVLVVGVLAGGRKCGVSAGIIARGVAVFDAFVHLIAAPSLRHFLCIPLSTVVNAPFVGPRVEYGIVDNNNACSAFYLWKLQPGQLGLQRGIVLVVVHHGRSAGAIVVVAAAGGKGNGKGDGEQGD